jgi:hypothetical protein
MAAFQFYLQSVSGDESHVFGQKFPDGEGSVMQQTVILPIHFGAKSLRILTQSP